MFRTRLGIDVAPLIEAEAFSQDFDAIIDDIANETFAEVQPHFLADLRHEPGPSKNGLNSDQPFRWSNNPVQDKKARRWWFANFPNGRNRTHQLRDGWTVVLEKLEGAWQVVVSNPTRYMKWVVGTFDQRRNWQIPGHARTGWVPVRQTTAFFFDTFQEAFLKRFDRVIPDSWGKASTRRRNR